MLTTLYRIFKYGSQSFSRNYLVSIATVLVMLLAVLVFQGVVLFSVIGNQALGIVKDKIDITVYFKEASPEDNILKIKTSLEGLREVKAVEYISKDEAIKRFREKHLDDEDITKALDEIKNNPLPAYLNIKAYDPKGYSTIAEYLRDDSFKNVVDKISYDEDQKQIIDKLGRVIEIGRSIGFILIIFLTMVASVISFNTILLAIHSNKDEIGIMRMVGASNAFVRGPYIVVGVIYGAIAAILAMIISSPFIFWSSPTVSVMIPGFNVWRYFLIHSPIILFYNLSFAVIIGVCSSVIVVRRYLVR